MYFVILIIVLVALLVFLNAIKVYNHWDNKGIPYIKPVYLLGNFAEIILRLRSFETLIKDSYNEFPNSRYVGMYQFRQPILQIRDPDLIKQITIKDFDVFPDHVPVFPRNLEPLFAKNVFNMSAQEGWHDMRSTLSPTFTSHKMKAFFTLMAECSNQFVNYLKKFDSKVSLELKDAFTRYANDVIATCAFGITCNSLKDRNNEFYLMGKEASNFSGIQNLKFLGYTLCPGLMKLLNIKFLSRAVDRFFRNIIKETLAIRKQQNIVRPDMINLLMDAQRNRENVDSGNKISLSDEDITAQALIFFLAGFDTVASAMTFLIYELAINQDIQQKLYREICTSCEEHAGKINYDIVTSMEYLESVLSESLRLHANVPFFDRKCTRPYTIEPMNPSERSLYLEKGTVIWIPTCALHHDEQYFPNPKKFDPERFSESNKQNIRPGAYVPFGSGPRRCIGSRFALLEMKLIIIQLLQHFEIVPDVKTAIPLEPDKTSFNGLPSEGVWVAFQPRVV